MIHYPAIYSEAILPEYKGNPLIEALPKKVPDEIIIERLGFYPEHKTEDLNLKPFEREEYLAREYKKICVSGILPIYLKGIKNAGIRPTYRSVIS